MVARLYNLARMTTATTGTGTITLGSAVAGFLSFANAGISDGDVVTYAIKDGSSSEIGRGTYTASGTTLARTTVLKSTNSNSAITLSGTAEVFLTPSAEDFLREVNAQTGTTYTVLRTDLGKRVTHSNASSIAVTLPQATGAFGSGFYYEAINIGAGVVTITPTTSTVNGLTSITLRQYHGAFIVSDGTNYTAIISKGDAALSGANSDITSLTALASVNTGPLAGLRNLLINGAMRVNQRGYYWPTGTTADDQYCFDRWYILAQTGTASSTVTFTNGSTSIGWTSHNRVVGDSFRLTTTGGLPTNFATSTTYWVVSVVDANTITVASAPGGTAISAGSAGSGTHTATGPSITVSQSTNIANGFPYALRLKQNASSSQRFGMAQIIESANIIRYRGSAMTLSARVQCSASTTLRYAIIEFTGTADSGVTSDVVNDWTSSTYTTGNFFISTSTTITATGSTALTANTPTTVSLNGTLGSSLTNVIVFFWTDSAQAQNVTLDVGNAQFEVGSTATSFEEVPVELVNRLCQRYFAQWDSSDYAFAMLTSGTFTSTTNIDASYNMPTRMRTIPSGTVSAASTFALDGGGAGSLSSVSIVDSTSINVIVRGVIASPTTTGFSGKFRAGNSLFARLALDAEI